MVTAGAGTGKTRLMVDRFVEGVKAGGWSGSNHLVVTFTVSAATELRERLAKAGYRKARVCTIHAWCWKRVRQKWPGVTLLNERQASRMLDSVMVDLAVSGSLLNLVAGEIAWAQANVLSPAWYFDSTRVAEVDRGTVATVYESYGAAKAHDRLVDYGDLPLLAGKLPGVSSIRAVSIDEAQDLSPAQVAALTPVLDARTVALVGDPEQAIFSWAGSDASIMAAWHADHRFELERSYRCTSGTLHWANRLRCDGLRLWSSETGPTPRVVSHVDSMAETEAFSKLRKSTHQSVAVLARTRARADALASVAPPGVEVITAHAAKGREWDTVHIASLADRSWPTPLATTAAALDEERRLLYVAITRARREVVVHVPGVASRLLELVGA